ncbi:MAG: hypothetical protein D9C04_04095 [Nitrosopumilus sp. B06]|nr:MAG: hypothetical protein D9C04_04095 [Nitrosopumilus sp. B06]
MTSDTTRKPDTLVENSTVVVSVLILAGIGFLVADASSLPLYKQIQSGVENRHLECSNLDHQLVIRPSLRPACVTAESALRAGWPDVMFLSNENMTVRYMLEVEVDGKKFPINATLKNGLIEEISVDSQTHTLSIKINPTEKGRVWLEIRNPSFLLPDPPPTILNWKDYLDILITDNQNIFHYQPWRDQSRLVVEFPFPDHDLKIDIGVLYPI